MSSRSSSSNPRGSGFNLTPLTTTPRSSSAYPFRNPLPAQSARLPLLLLTFLLLITAACGGDDDADSGSNGPVGTPGPALVLGPQEVCDVDLAVTPPDVTVYGADAGDFLADRFSLATGDFNADGLGDILVGAPLGDSAGNTLENAGEAYVIYGSSTLSPTIDLDASSPGVVLNGGAAGDNFGFTVAAGDVNGDGTDDVLVGARFAGTPDRPAAGQAYVYFGGPELAGQFAPSDADFTITGAAANDFLSIALATGDIDGDGTDDILMGAGGADGEDAARVDAGAVVVVRGSGELPETFDLAFEQPALTVFGAATGDSIPNHLAAGDLAGDDAEELIIGAPYADSADFEDAGRVYVVSSDGDGETIDLANGSDFELLGAARKDLLGFEVASADVNGDGAADLIAGARDADGPAEQVNNGGEIHVILGADLGGVTDLASTSSDALITSAGEGDSIGFTVATADMNADGLADIIAGAPIADGCMDARPDAGDVYIINGRNPMPGTVTITSTGDLTYLGMQELDAAGFSAAATDLNDDSKQDLIIGALQADGPEDSRPDAGEVWIVYGK